MDTLDDLVNARTSNSDKTYPTIKAFFCHGVRSGILFKMAVSGYESKKETMSLTV
jgi:hypothetical protein